MDFNEKVRDLSLGFWGFDGFDWDYEGFNDPANPGNTF